MKHKEEINNI